MMILFIIFLLIIFVYFFKEEKKLLDIRRTRIIQIVHLLSLVLVCWIIYLKQYDMSFRGYIIEKIIYWIFYFSALCLLVFGNPKLIKGIRKVYCFLYLFAPLILVFTLTVPFLGLALVFTLENEFFGDFEVVKYSDKNFRLEMPFTGILGSKPESPTLIVKKGLFEYKDQVLSSVHSNGVFRYEIYKKSSNIIWVNSYVYLEGKPSKGQSVKVHLKHPLN